MTNLEKGSLIILCAVIVFIIIFLCFMLYFTKKREQEKNKPAEKVSKLKHGMPYEDIKKFLPFDDIKNNMIVQENGERFTMLIECAGINYYLMSEAEKIAVEEGFIQFLNSIRFPIQIYVQSRTINLDESIESYKEHLQKHTDEFNKLLNTFSALDAQGASEDKLVEVGLLIEKKEKALDYTKDLIDNISYLTQNSNVLQKKYYIVVSYHISELGLINNLDNDEMFNLAYTELTNRADSIRGGIYSCGIESHILTTSELTEVMYIAVNRDDSDIFNIKKVVDSDILSISTTARDVVFKKQDLAREERKAREIQEEKERVMRQEIERRKELENEMNYNNNTVDSSTML